MEERWFPGSQGPCVGPSEQGRSPGPSGAQHLAGHRLPVSPDCAQSLKCICASSMMLALGHWLTVLSQGLLSPVPDLC